MLVKEDGRVRLPDSLEEVPAILADRRRTDGLGRRSLPDGWRDEKGRWFPSKQEWASCCDRVRKPSMAWPNSLYRHCCTRAHLEHLAAARAMMHEFAGRLIARAAALGYDDEVALRLLDEEAAREGQQSFEDAMKHAAAAQARKERSRVRREKLESHYAALRLRQLQQFLEEHEAMRARLVQLSPVPLDGQDADETGMILAAQLDFIERAKEEGRPPKGWNPFLAQTVTRATRRRIAYQAAIARREAKLTRKSGERKEQEERAAHG